ncbi:peroxidase 5-like [Prosopis cineraria]|uniref:peroxidase 5-like n=1 Tax=Prosopis cineraria TaxID=364024 RepID=UPI00240FE1AC|nr:peroxidase 5-like [Prosopis cineraria]
MTKSLETQYVLRKCTRDKDEKKEFFGSEKMHKCKLQEDFYGQSCPKAEQIVADQVAQVAKTNPDAIAALIRLQFHDCFVGGCDASILLDEMPTGDAVEKSSMFNGELLKGADIIDDIKAKLEQECPGIVSCADILAFAASESLVLGGLPAHQPKLGGRRDGLVSIASNAESNLPLPTWSMDQMLQLFNRKGFNEEDFVVLLGAHSIGAAHCSVFSDRLYNYEQSGKSDPALTQEVIKELKQKCKIPGTPEARENPRVNFDETPTIVDNIFFRNLVERKKALLASDQLLIVDNRTALIVEKMARDPNLFPRKFVVAMMRLASLGVLTMNEGEVRTTCRATNN